MHIQPLNAANPGYWDEVKRLTKMRNAGKLLNAKLQRLPTTQIYEQYVAWHSTTIRQCCTEAGVTSCPDSYREFRTEWAMRLMMPELIEENEDTILSNSSDAVTEAHRLLYEE